MKTVQKSNRENVFISSITSWRKDSKYIKTIQQPNRVNVFISSITSWRKDSKFKKGK